ncbi:MAG: tyrosine--tRNA ligase [Patescibacteria group bacterium]|nr:tyrosine--tRNA ligase [Patescibacteria group bacterium]MDE2218660.1 tyrosine--tRNA ligase [Patescibacteria group bacterium]
MNKVKIIEDISRTTEEFFSLEELKKLLNSGRQLCIKYGVDVTAPTLHIGHAVNLWVMRKFQDLGHKVVFLIGDFTTQIGDPTGKNKTRPIIPREEIEKNTLEFIEQAKMVLRFDDPNLLDIRKNSEWFDKLLTSDFLRLMSMITHARLISRDMFQKRIENEMDIYGHELIYPILQGYDSVILKSDLTIIGSDQLFNEMLGRFYQERFGQNPQVIITTKITHGIDGKEKQSKSLGNYIGLAHSPSEKFGRVMSIPDNLIVEYFKIYTEVPMEDISNIEKLVLTNPMSQKKLLAFKIVERYHGKETAKDEQEWFEKTFSERIIPSDIEEIEVESTADVFISVHKYFGLKKSKSEVRRLFAQGSVSLNQEKIIDTNQFVKDGDVLKVGKRVWFRVRFKDGSD